MSGRRGRRLPDRVRESPRDGGVARRRRRRLPDEGQELDEIVDTIRPPPAKGVRSRHEPDGRRAQRGVGDVQGPLAHLLAIALVVYVAVGLVSLVLSLLLDYWAAGSSRRWCPWIATFWLQGALVKAVDDVRDGRPDLSLGETFAGVRPQLVAIIVAGVLAALGVILGLILLIVPGLYLLTRWILIIPIIVLEGRTAGESFGRSWSSFAASRGTCSASSS